MATIHQQIEVDAEPAPVGSTWSRFIEWAHRGPGTLSVTSSPASTPCAPGSSFRAAPAGRPDHRRLPPGGVAGGPPPKEIERRLGHDLVVFKDYIERGSQAPTGTEKIAAEVDADRKGDHPRHVRLSSEDETTFWRSHFPT